MNKIISQKDKSFTLVEILVSIAIFTVVFTAALGIFTSTLKSKAQVEQIKEVESDGRYLMELMTREIRMGAISGSQAGNNDSDLSFIDAHGNSIVYRLNANEQLEKNSNVISSNKIKFTNLNFNVNDFINNILEPKVTISMTIQSVQNSNISMDFQNTISLLNKNQRDKLMISANRVFVSSLKVRGDMAGLGNITGADLLCQNWADTAGLGGTWMAWISAYNPYTHTAWNVRDRIQDGPFVIYDGSKWQFIAGSKGDLLDCSINHPINYDEYGNLVATNERVWSSTDCSGGNTSYRASWDFCGHHFGAVGYEWDCCWLGATPVGQGGVGFVGQTGSSWAGSSTFPPCTNRYRLYCFEETYTNVEIPPSIDLKRVFISSEMYHGAFGGLAGADGRCQSLADAAGIGGTWRAWLSTNTVDAKDRIADALYYNQGPSERSIIAFSKGDLIDGSIRNLIKYNENGNFTNGRVWTGTNSNGEARQFGSTYYNCNHWTSASSSLVGRIGTNLQRDGGWTSSSNLQCHWDYNTRAHLYCFEE